MHHGVDGPRIFAACHKLSPFSKYNPVHYPESVLYVRPLGRQHYSVHHNSDDSEKEIKYGVPLEFEMIFIILGRGFALERVVKCRERAN